MWIILSPTLSKGEGDVTGLVLDEYFGECYGIILSPTLSKGEEDVTGLIFLLGIVFGEI